MIQNTIQTIEKNKKDDGLKFKDQEFTILCQFTDEDDYNRPERLDDYLSFSKKCRYSDILTYSDTRVNLISSNSYINASWINIPYKHFFISTQGPTPNTIEDFWTMIFDHNIKIIVMLCNLFENGSEKCSNYWDGKFKKFTIKKEKEEKSLNSIIQRTLKVSNGKEEKTVIQLHFTGWPDKGIPEIEGVFDDFEYMFNYIKGNNGGSPTVVHCSAGVGRTGTFIACYILYREILSQIHDNQKKEIKFSVFGIVRKLKEMRMFLVQSESQYNFIYYFVSEILKIYNSK